MPRIAPRQFIMQSKQLYSKTITWQEEFAMIELVPEATIPTVLEFLREWPRREHYDDLPAIFKEQGEA